MSCNFKFLTLFILQLIIVCKLTQAEVFTSIADVESLIDTHKNIINLLENYISKEETRLSILKDQLIRFQSEHDNAVEDVSNYLGNPINAFTLIKRLTADLADMENDIQVNTGYFKNVITIEQTDEKYPSEEDLDGAAVAMTRLQKTYNLDVQDLAEGLIKGVAYSHPMSSGDCYALGLALYRNDEHQHCLDWMKQAYRKYKQGDNSTYTFDEKDMLGYMSYAYYKLDDIPNALELMYELREIDPTHNLALTHIPEYEKIIEDAKSNATLEKDKQKPKITYGGDMYSALCRGEYVIAQEIAKNLKCFYKTGKNPFLKLAAIKTEQIYANPDVYVYRDVISDDEIENIQNLAKPNFKRATVYNNEAKKGKSVRKTSEIRITKTSWLGDTYPVVARISRRVADFTELHLDTAEALQVANYGIGGHYSPHYDFAQKEHTRFKESLGTQRHTTVLFYISDVSEGGATVFTKLGLSVFPEKGSALVWPNLHPSGEGNKGTMHGACPVLRGSKWVANKWIHVDGQEFNTPCNLEYQEEDTPLTFLPPMRKSDLYAL